MKKKTSHMTAIQALMPGDSLSFPIESMFAIRTAACNVNTLRGYPSVSTKIDRTARTIAVTCNSLIP